MLKLTVKRFAPLSLLPLAGNALAHPGSHVDMAGWGILEHFLSSPFHAGVVVVAAVLLAIGVIWSVKRGR